MENIRVSHTAYPDGKIVNYTDGMDKPQVFDFSKVIKKSLFNAVQQRKNKATEVIKLKPVREVRRPLYAVK